MWQTKTVRDDLLRRHPGLSVVLSAQSTQGDREQQVALQDIGGKDLFAQDLQQRLAIGSAAVHSLKDLSVNNKPGLCLAATLKRANPCDALVSHQGTFDELPAGARIGTASPRRRSQLLAARPDLDCQLIRGNVGTRLAKLDRGEFDAIILAYCGLDRLGLSERVTETLDPTVFIPAIGQAVVGVECLSSDKELQTLLQSIHCVETAVCVEAERAFNRYLGGDCFSAIAAHATVENEQLTMRAYVGSLDGQHQLRTQGSGRSPETLGINLAKELEAQGARDLLHQE
jgi:hydroxymethylbilane synthase